jgi:hypothetical protein
VSWCHVCTVTPGIVFSLAVATVATGFPGWWEPMTQKHLRLHMIVAFVSSGMSAALPMTTTMIMKMSKDLPADEVLLARCLMQS